MTQGNLFPQSCERLHVDDQRRKLQARLAQQDTTLAQACPVCEQHVQLYKRKVYATIARWLIWLVKEYEQTKTWVAARNTRGGDYAKLAMFGLIEQHAHDPDDGRTRTTNLWRPTSLGLAFVYQRTDIPKYVLTFNGKVWGHSTERATIHDALGKRFDYAELMAGGSDE